MATRPAMLDRVPVAHLEQRARHEDRDPQRRSGHQFAVVEVPGVATRRVAAHTAQLWRRRDPHAAEERLQRNHDPGGELGRHRLAVELEDSRAARALAAVAGQVAAAPVVAVVDRQVDREDFHLEDVARFGTFDVHGTRQDVAAGSAARITRGDPLGHGHERRLDLLVRDARRAQPARRVREQGIDVDDVARRDAQRRRRL
jgi:hypothetical protein